MAFLKLLMRCFSFNFHDMSTNLSSLLWFIPSHSHNHNRYTTTSTRVNARIINLPRLLNKMNKNILGENLWIACNRTRIFKDATSSYLLFKIVHLTEREDISHQQAQQEIFPQICCL